MRSICYRIIESGLGPILIAGHPAGLREIIFLEGSAAREPGADWVGDRELLEEAETQLRQYLAGERTRFELRLDPGGTPFQQRVWRELRAIPYGTTISYGELARRIGQPSAARAVGAANGRNPLAIVVPCHRVIGGDGRLTGYAGGLRFKEALLALESGELSLAPNSRLGS